MITHRPRRLDGVSYVGYSRYFVTTCTASRRAVFVTAPIVAGALMQLEQCCTLLEFALSAYCFMTDHLHVLLVAQSEASDLCAFVKRFKQITGFPYKQQFGERLWQHGYHERVLRNDEGTLAVARYILENPVRAGLSRQLGHYPFAGSLVYSWPALLNAWDSCEQT